jgi:prepilin-type processing-associated H-X9-DG protein
MNVSRVGMRVGFSLVELLVVIGVIGVLVGLLMSAVQAVRGAAARSACANNLRQVGIACQHYHETHNSFPPAYAGYGLGPDRGLTWPVILLPYIEQEPLFHRTLEATRATPYTFLNPPHVGLTTVVKVYTCPADGRLSGPITDDKGYTAAYGSYQGVAGGRARPEGGTDGAMRADRGVNILEITDGASNTLLVGERPPSGRLLSGNWYTRMIPDPIAMESDPNWAGGGIDYMHVFDPRNIGTCRGPFRFSPGRVENHCDSFHFWSLHPGGAHFAFADGSVRFLSYSANDLLPALATRAGGEPVSVPD